MAIFGVQQSHTTNYTVNKNTSKTSNVNIGPIFGIKYNAFENKTISLIYPIKHSTKLLDTAQKYLGVIVEATPEEYSKLSDIEKRNTQQVFIGNYGSIDEAWCAYAVSSLCEQAGVNIGEYKKAVSQFIKWAQENKTYHPISTNSLSSINFVNERQQRTNQIKKQFKNLKEGDLIVWKSDTYVDTQNGFVKANSSHIGIFEGFNYDGSIIVMEGNANNFKTGEYERYVATTEKEAKNGNQQVGEFQEINSRDGFIRKTYTAEELAANGYSGYIDMQKIIK